jgi:hypothetical protein
MLDSDNVIGTPDKPPQLCAVSGKPIQAGFAIRYHLTGSFYVLVLPKYQPGMTDELRDEYRASVLTTKSKRGK